MADDYAVAIQYYRDGNYIQAKTCFHTYLEDNQHDHKAWNALGVTYSRLGMIEQADTCFDNALILSPHSERYKKNKQTLAGKKAGPVKRVKKQVNTESYLPSLNIPFRIKHVIGVLFVIGVPMFILIMGLNSLSGSTLNAASNQVSQALPPVNTSSVVPTSESGIGGILDQVNTVGIAGPGSSSLSLMDSASAIVSGGGVSVTVGDSQPVTVTKEGSLLYVTYNGGGTDTYDIMSITVNWPDGSSESIGNIPGKTVTHQAGKGQNHVFVTATFTDGKQQVIGDTSV